MGIADHVVQGIEASAGTTDQVSVPTAPPRIAVLVPCFNEEVAIGKVVRDFRAALPDATVYVYDNNSTDDTRAVAVADIEADVYVLVDRLEAESLDMVNADRVTDIQAAYRPGHRVGNVLLTSIVQFIFGSRIGDLLSGYRVFSRRYVKSFPALSSGFEIETELTVHALELRMPIAEVPTSYKDRPEGSTSKLRTFRDGFRILRTIAILLKEERPLQFFSWLFAALAAVSIVLAWPVAAEYLRTGLVPRLPTAVLSTGVMLLALHSLFSGLVLDTVTVGRRELKRMAYLAVPRHSRQPAGPTGAR